MLVKRTQAEFAVCLEGLTYLGSDSLYIQSAVDGRSAFPPCKRSLTAMITWAQRGRIVC